MANTILTRTQIGTILMFIKEKIPSIHRIGITGSYSTGMQTLKSDLDIVIDIDINQRERFWEVAEEVKKFLINEYLLPVDFIFYDDVQKKIKPMNRLSVCDEFEVQMYTELLGKTKWEGGGRGKK